MGIFYEKTDDRKYHVYRMKSRLLWFSYILLIIIVVYASVKTNSAYLTPLWILLSLIGVIEYAPIGCRRFMAHVRNKEEIAKGNIFSGNVEIKIEK